MFVVNFDKELRDAFAAGQASMMPLVKGVKGTMFDSIPRTYEEWIESKRGEPQIMRG